jgi:hypothetical protein
MKIIDSRIHPYIIKEGLHDSFKLVEIKKSQVEGEEGEELHVNVGYYTKLEYVFKRIIDLKTNNIKQTFSLEDYLNRYKSIGSSVMEAFEINKLNTK